MHLTKFSDNALRCLIYLGTHPDDVCTVREIADCLRMSADHLVKVVQRLASLGYVETSRGVGGGVRLAVAPNTIRLGRLVRETEQRFAMVECFTPETNQCPITAVCALPGILDNAVDAFLGVLDEHTLADLIRDPRRLRRAYRCTDAA
jgi:Rrf2 family nitric oxide-sensitive transcriptional repressor